MKDKVMIFGVWILFLCMSSTFMYGRVFTSSLDELLVKVNTIKYLQSSPVKSIEEVKGVNKIDLNKATIGDLMTIPGIGRVLAERIVAYRDKRGGFSSVEEIKNVAGIGEKNFLKIKPYLIVYKNSVSVNINYSHDGNNQNIDYDLQITTINKEVLKLSGEILKDPTGKKFSLFLEYAMANATSQANVRLFLQVINNLVQQLQVSLNYQENPQKKAQIKERISQLESLREDLIQKQKNLPPYNDQQVNTPVVTSKPQPAPQGLYIVDATPPLDGRGVDPVSTIKIIFSEPIKKVDYMAVIPVGVKNQILPGNIQIVGNTLYYSMNQPMMYNQIYIVKLMGVKGMSGVKNFEYQFKTEKLLSADNLNKAVQKTSMWAAIFSQVSYFLNILNGILNPTSSGNGGNQIGNEY